MIKNITKEKLEEIVKQSLSIANVCRKLNVLPYGGNYKLLKNKFYKWNIDISHFTGQGWNKGERFKPFYKKQLLKDILIENSQYSSTNNLKTRLYNEELKKRECELCGQGEKWRGKKIALILDHKNGINNDNRLENLQIVCPNCNATLDTFCGRNKKKKEKKQKIIKEKKQYFCKCGNKINRRSKCCIKCNNLNKRRHKRPSYDVLIKNIKELGFSSTGKKYGVSDNAIRKWIKIIDK